MGVFQRISDILKSNINDLLDKAEDPEKMVKQIINDLQKDLNNSTQALAKAMASQRMTERQLNDAKARSADWEDRAEAAVRSGNEQLAKSALANKVRADEQVTEYQKMYNDISAQTAQMQDQVGQLKEKLDEAKNKEAMLIARSQMADTRKNLAKNTGTFDASSAADKFDRMEEKITRKEAEADAYSDIASQNAAGSAQDYDKLSREAKVDDEYAKLLAKMGANSIEDKGENK